MNRLEINVFEKTDTHPSRNGRGNRPVEALDPSHRLFLKELQNAADRFDIELMLKGKKWPIAADRELSELEAFSYYAAPEYKADMGVYFARNIYEFGPEIGHAIMHSNETMRHIFLVTSQPTTSEYEEYAQGLLPVTPDFIEEEDSVIAYPIHASYSTGERDEDGTLGKISIFDIPKMRTDRSRQRMREVLLTG